MNEVPATPEIAERAAIPPPIPVPEKAPTPFLRAEAHFERMKPYDRVTRELFVAEYMFDFDPINAACRIGYKGQTAKNMAKKFMSEPGVARLIRERQQEFDSANAINADRIMAGLLKEATREGFGASHAARVGAWTNLAKIIGVGQPEDPTLTIPGGVMVIPATPANLQQWENGASQSQAQLKHDVGA